MAADGHFLPLVPLASAFRDRGDEVAVATAASFAPRVEAAGLQSIPAGIDQRALEAQFAPHRAEIGTMPFSERRPHGFSRRFALLDAPARVVDLRRQAEAWQPDLIVHESAELAGPLVAAVLGIASVHHSFGRMIPIAAIDAAASIATAMWDEAGIAPEPAAGLFRGPFVDICPPGLASERPPAGTLVRPLRAVRALPPESTERSLIYLTLGTIVTDLAVYRLVLSALADSGADVLVTTGRQNDPTALDPVPENAVVEHSVPQAEVLPRCALVAIHGGSGSMLGALAHGLPMLVLPRAADQFENAAALVAAGAAEALLPDELTADAVRRKVAPLLHESGYRETTRGLAAEIAAMPSADEVAEQLARATSPSEDADGTRRSPCPPADQCDRRTRSGRTVAGKAVAISVACASVHECTLSRGSEEAARAASSALAMVETAERLLDRDLEASDYAGVAASRE